MITSVMFTLLYVPQMLLNRRRKSVEGFSSQAIVIKLFGAAFLTVNSLYTGEAIPVIAYGTLNVAQHSLFMLQFFTYAKIHNFRYLVCIIVAPLLPYLAALYFPGSLVVTNYFKPLSQVFSIVPQLLECRRLQTASGVSLLSQHLNFLGGLMGIYMCSIIPPKSSITWFLYINSCGQAFCIYAMWLWYDSPFQSKRHASLSYLPVDISGKALADKEQ